jgi:phenylacetate-coenzyme A ligase PaaK-like adenylate-forming protein
MIWNDEFETLPREVIESLQLKRLQQTLERVYATVPFYRRSFTEAGVTPGMVKSLGDLRRLPFTLKQDMRDNYPYGLFAVPLEQIIRIHASSGTTGKPTVVGYTRRDIKMWAELMARSFAAAGAHRGDVIHNAYGYASQIESVLFNIDGVEPHYQLIVDREGNLDTLEVQVEVNEQTFSDEVKVLQDLTGRIRKEIKDLLGITCKVRLVEPKSIARSEGKAQRVIDRRD